jgi:hypothetical protein
MVGPQRLPFYVARLFGFSNGGVDNAIVVVDYSRIEHTIQQTRSAP